MIHSIARLPGMTNARSYCTGAAVLFVAALMVACGSGGSGVHSDPLSPTTACVPADPATAENCGTLIVALTDGDGDFLSYSVNVLSLTLEKADGTTINVLPNAARVDFARYTDLTEFASVGSIPPGVYVAGTIQLDYANAEVFVESGGSAVATNVVDATGNPLGRTTLKIRLSDRNQLLITRARTALLTLDFDLDASHSIDLDQLPAVATAEPFILAEIDPVDAKEIRVRGRLVDVSEPGMYYVVALRPFYVRDGEFGRLKVQVADDTTFEVDHDRYTGLEGLRALNSAGPGTVTVAQGQLDVSERTFTAATVLAGSSVPGHDKDAVKGNVISRTGNDLVVRGGAVILSNNDRSFYRDDITVAVGPDTIVYKTRKYDWPIAAPLRLLDTAAVSIGQSVTIRGIVVVNDETRVHIDATDGAVLMHPTNLGGIVKTVMNGQTDIELQSIDRRRASVFDFTGTGIDRLNDADPANYEIATGNLVLPAQAEGKPVVVHGFPNRFGEAPPDFEGRTIVNYSDVRSALGVGWGAEGTTTPFLMSGQDGLLLDNQNRDIDQRHFIKQGPVLIDLASLPTDTLIAPRAAGRKLFGIKSTEGLRQYSDFDDFVAALSLQLNGVNAARSMYARGLYDADTNVFHAYKIFVHVLNP